MHKIVVQAVAVPLHHFSASPKITSLWQGQCSSWRKQLEDASQTKWGSLKEECASVWKARGAALRQGLRHYWLSTEAVLAQGVMEASSRQR